MGVDCVSFLRLVELASQVGPIRGRSVMLGRQEMFIAPRHQKHCAAALSAHGFDFGFEDAVGTNGFAEEMFRTLGFGDIEALDYSEFEGAQIVQDLGAPLAEDLEGEFSFIFDGGTIEHVFNAPQAFENVFNMLADDGVFVSATCLNGWPFHGFYQFSPELAYSFWKRTAGCEVRRCLAMPKDPKVAPIDLPDPAELGRRIKGRTVPDGQVYLYYEVRKPTGAAVLGKPLQSDYHAQWTSHTSSMSERGL